MAATQSREQSGKKSPERGVFLRLSDELDAKIEETSRRTGLKRPDIIKLCVTRGIDRLLEHLTTEGN